MRLTPILLSNSKANKTSGENQDEERQELVNRDEKREALEQWLRRVPDEPGGLLRRKFQHETKQRLRNGEYENRQGEKYGSRFALLDFATARNNVSWAC
ncbi:MAG: hypothetical protein CM15mP120_03260 [Pseudomonadota bacterium]|nr:MAG: hypothetical protein CM15mP120_03260 [Pseudomonadota bacterium]